MKRKYVIGEIIDKATGKRSEKFAYRVGRTCQLDDEYVNEGVVLIVGYPERNAYLRTSTVLSIDEDDRGIWVETLNSKYRFDNLYNS